MTFIFSVLSFNLLVSIQWKIPGNFSYHRIHYCYCNTIFPNNESVNGDYESSYQLCYFKLYT